MVFDPEALKDASINYCVKLLQNNKVDPEFKDEIELENLLHYYRMMENCQDDEELSMEDFQNRLKKIDSKCSDKYQFLLKGGQGFKNCY